MASSDPVTSSGSPWRDADTELTKLVRHARHSMHASGSRLRGVVAEFADAHELLHVPDRTGLVGRDRVQATAEPLEVPRRGDKSNARHSLAAAGPVNVKHGASVALKSREVLAVPVHVPQDWARRS